MSRLRVNFLEVDKGTPGESVFAIDYNCNDIAKHSGSMSTLDGYNVFSSASAIDILELVDALRERGKSVMFSPDTSYFQTALSLFVIAIEPEIEYARTRA